MTGAIVASVLAAIDIANLVDLTFFIVNYFSFKSLITIVSVKNILMKIVTVKLSK